MKVETGGSIKLWISYFDKINRKNVKSDKSALVRLSRIQNHISRKQNKNSVTLQQRLLACC